MNYLQKKQIYKIGIKLSKCSNQIGESAALTVYVCVRVFAFVARSLWISALLPLWQNTEESSPVWLLLLLMN